MPKLVKKSNPESATTGKLSRLQSFQKPLRSLLSSGPSFRDRRPTNGQQLPITFTHTLIACASSKWSRCSPVWRTRIHPLGNESMRSSLGFGATAIDAALSLSHSFVTQAKIVDDLGGQHSSQPCSVTHKLQVETQ